MKKIIILLILTFWLLFPLETIQAVENEMAKNLAGRILLQVESYGRAWYVDPVSLERYYLQDGNEAYFLMKTKGLGITNSDLAQIPTKKGQAFNKSLVNRLKGRILLQVNEHGEAWYVDPIDGLRYYMKDGQAAYSLMRTKSLGISNEDLAQISMNQNQIVHDTTFDDIAYVSFDGQNFSAGYNTDQILPLASLSKLMTALVFLDTSPDWNKQVEITQEQIDYPKKLAGDDSTSEVDLATGDVVSIYDLWVAMLVSSSNQAAIVLVDASGLNRAEFVVKMNEKATELNLTKTKFYDPSGLDAHNVTTAKEMAKMAYLAFSNPKIIEVQNLKDYNILATTIEKELKTIKVLDRNYSLQQFGVEASKTGFLVEAQRTVALKKNNIIVVILHALSMNQRNDLIKKMIQS